MNFPLLNAYVDGKMVELMHERAKPIMEEYTYLSTNRANEIAAAMLMNEYADQHNAFMNSRHLLKVEFGIEAVNELQFAIMDQEDEDLGAIDVLVSASGNRNAMIDRHILREQGFEALVRR